MGTAVATLFVVIDEEELDFELEEGENQIGRHPDCPITLAQPSVSGRHAMIHGEGGKFTVEDIGSRNGTFVNEQRVEGRVRLKHNDALRFGSARGRFHDPAEQTVAAAKPSSATVADANLATMDLGAARVNIDEASDASITSQLAGAGRFGALDVNPEAKLKAVLDISKEPLTHCFI
jgi:pSer/pThr/pTyr-binding forkhead associated (FHA) protein